MGNYTEMHETVTPFIYLHLSKELDLCLVSFQNTRRVGLPRLYLVLGVQIMSFTANSIEGAAFIDKGWIEKVFRKAVEAEERVSLMKKLIKQKLGVAEVEEFFSDLADTHRNTKYRSLLS